MVTNRFLPLAVYHSAVLVAVDRFCLDSLTAVVAAGTGLILRTKYPFVIS